jgi:hypothetical protein
MTALSPRGRKAKGNRAEREVVQLFTDELGITPRRTLAGHREDHGDLSGVPSLTIQVKSMADITRAIREGIADLEKQHANTGDPHAALFIRCPGGRYIVVQTFPQFAAMYREAVAVGDPQ